MVAKIVVTQPVHAEQVQRLRDAGHEVVTLDSPRGLSAAELIEHTKDADALLSQLTDKLTEEVFAETRLTIVATIATGFDNIDVDAAQKAGTIVTRTPDVLTDATADLAMTLMLAVARQIPESDASTREHGTGPFQLLREPMGIDISGATLGIVGLGRIGEALAHRAHFGFGMKILYTARSAHPAAEERFGASRLPLGQLLAESDVVSLHVPLNDETRHLIDRETLTLMKPTAILINTGRGPLINERDLAEALRTNQLAGAGLDVFENEPDVHPDLLAVGSRAVLTPHIGSATAKTRRAMASLAVDNILAVLAGDPPLTPVK
ncbi:2-hydroxyacid dehydrogenase [Cryptosporangium arvum]|uniref:Lactate dehydrogenase-like oxidoreductase n=1 Tax=Cryptosporangium arvum DSM 44712 TaxID=927661 RepID=A0A010ZRK3_9ACTN|nr:D-glycerate dehydrogenase [Cryptosporangium arvum]EXG79837.1 lactate dehydrogenase-like oxidoreductase [Cryptosporangium arvum DSM 44712]